MTNDWAIAVGIGKYPDHGFERLKGPELDAREFHSWVTSKAGGSVPKKQAKLIVSPAQMPKSVINAQPAAEQVQEFFEHLDTLARKRASKMAGRRLYLYFSGHGFAPGQEEVGLLMANAARNRLKHHIPGKAWANLFFRSGYFEEVLLFMDCCRTNLPHSIPNPPSFTASDNPQAIKNGRRLFVFAAKWGTEARERMFNGKQTRGVFTVALLDGLRGRACAPGTSEVTANSLRSYFHNSMRTYLPEVALNDPSIPEEPDIEPSQSPSADFTIVEVAKPPKFAGGAPTAGSTVRVLLSANAKGKKIRILNGALTQEMVSGTAKPPHWKTVLPRGLYKAELQGVADSRLFEVKGTAKEVIDVDFRQG